MGGMILCWYLEFSIDVALQHLYTFPLYKSLKQSPLHSICFSESGTCLKSSSKTLGEIIWEMSPSRGLWWHYPTDKQTNTVNVSSVCPMCLIPFSYRPTQIAPCSNFAAQFQSTPRGHMYDDYYQCSYWTSAIIHLTATAFHMITQAEEIGKAMHCHTQCRSMMFSLTN